MVFPPADIHSFGIIRPVVFFAGKGPTGKLIFPMIGGKIRIGRKDHLVVLIGVNRDIGPAQHPMGIRRTVGNVDSGLDVGSIRVQRQADGPGHAVSQFEFPDPNGLAPIRIVPQSIVYRQKRGGPMVMGNVPFHSARDPSSQHAYQGRFYNGLAVKEIITVGLIQSREYTPPYLGQNAEFDVFIFKIESVVLNIPGFIGQLIYDGIGINPPLSSLIGPAVIENWERCPADPPDRSEAPEFLPRPSHSSSAPKKSG